MKGVGSKDCRWRVGVGVSLVAAIGRAMVGMCLGGFAEPKHTT
jgi:hypothetical protein